MATSTLPTPAQWIGFHQLITDDYDATTVCTFCRRHLPSEASARDRVQHASLCRAFPKETFHVLISAVFNGGDNGNKHAPVELPVVVKCTCPCMCGARPEHQCDPVAVISDAIESPVKAAPKDCITTLFDEWTRHDMELTDCGGIMGEYWARRLEAIRIDTMTQLVSKQGSPTSQEVLLRMASLEVEQIVDAIERTGSDTLVSFRARSVQVALQAVTKQCGKWPGLDSS